MTIVDVYTREAVAKGLGRKLTVCTDKNCPVHDPEAAAEEAANPAPTMPPAPEVETEEEAAEREAEFERQRAEYEEERQRRRRNANSSSSVSKRSMRQSGTAKPKS